MNIRIQELSKETFFFLFFVTYMTVKCSEVNKGYPASLQAFAVW